MLIMLHFSHERGGAAKDYPRRPPTAREGTLYRQASIRQDGYELFFHNERAGDPDSAGIWVKPRLVFVPRYDPGHGGDFGEVAQDCRKITWSDKGAVWERE